jgi:hypothetical protein
MTKLSLRFIYFAHSLKYIMITIYIAIKDRYSQFTKFRIPSLLDFGKKFSNSFVISLFESWSGFLEMLSKNFSLHVTALIIKHSAK